MPRVRRAYIPNSVSKISKLILSFHLYRAKITYMEGLALLVGHPGLRLLIVHFLSWGYWIRRLHLCKWVSSSTNEFFCLWHKIIWWLGPHTRASGNLKYSFIVISQRYTLTRMVGIKLTFVILRDSNKSLQGYGLQMKVGTGAVSTDILYYYMDTFNTNSTALIGHRETKYHEEKKSWDSWCLVGCCRQDLFKIARSILV